MSVKQIAMNWPRIKEQPPDRPRLEPVWSLSALIAMRYLLDEFAKATKINEVDRPDHVARLREHGQSGRNRI
jgi:hypothetical protein